MQSSRRRKKKFSQDLKHSHHRVRTTSLQSINTTRSNDFWQENSAAGLDVKQHAFPSEAKLKKRRLYVRDVYVINVQPIEKKTSEKRTKKQPKNSFICALKKQAIFTQKRSPFPQRREQATQLFYQQHTQRQQQQQQ